MPEERKKKGDDDDDDDDFASAAMKSIWAILSLFRRSSTLRSKQREGEDVESFLAVGRDACREGSTVEKKRAGKRKTKAFERRRRAGGGGG